ncbi:MAG: Ni/Fe hydrogenase subunit alpha [Nitrospirota bacterium]
MNRKITIEPVTKIEGHGKVTVFLDDKGEVSDAHFHVTEFRGFEKFCEGRMFWDMPVITTRICGICPVSHHLASAKACDDLLGIEIPPAAKKLRELMHMGQFIHSHSLHFFFLAAPDFVMGYNSDPLKRSVIGILEKDPDLARKAIKLRKIGQTIIDKVGGRPIHPVTAIPGGMSKPLSHEDRFNLKNMTKDAIALSSLSVEIAEKILESAPISDLGDIKTAHMGLVKNGNLELYDGRLRMIDENGKIMEEFNTGDYLDYIGEHVEDYSWLKFPFYKKKGWPGGVYRVAPISRLNVADRISTPLASAKMKSITDRRPLQANMYYHYARTIELLYAAERAFELLSDDEIVSRDVRVRVDRKEGGSEGIGVIEAPRGTLIHHYWTEDSKISKVNIIVATAHNNKAMDLSVAGVANAYIHKGAVNEGILNKIEMAIRCYDPCLSCSTHAIGKMPLKVDIVSRDGTILKQMRKD